MVHPGGPVSILYLVRHGQTEGFVHGSYKQLTDLGVRQSQALGRWFRDRSIVPDASSSDPWNANSRP